MDHEFSLYHLQNWELLVSLKETGTQALRDQGIGRSAIQGSNKGRRKTGMITVREILMTKGDRVWSVSPETTVYDALQVMADKDIGALLVIEAGKLVGIFSERDYARKVILKGKSSREITVHEIMSPRVYYVRPEQSVEECMAVMTDKRIRHLPVLRDGELAGVISIGDVVKAIISDQQFTIEQLERYITGTGYGR
jgi:CBS domain-containing protein